MKKNVKRGRVASEINITPFTDVVLVLLIIFMIATPVLLQPGIKVELPKAQAADSNTEKNISITIGDNGEIYLDDQRMDIGKLKYEIATRLSKNPSMAVIVKGDKEVKYELVVKVIDAAKLSGAKKFALGVDLKDGSF
ncbi:MAG: biopolymer transporter ExbD [Desulfobacteraceae bacterium]|jgi:biopolymer transport protein ExbD